MNEDDFEEYKGKVMSEYDGGNNEIVEWDDGRLLERTIFNENLSIRPGFLHRDGAQDQDLHD